MSMTPQAAGLDPLLAASQKATGGGGLYLGRTA